jgi:hypothetical protein
MIALTLAYWFTQHEKGGFPVERAALGSCDLSICCISAASGNGSSAAVMAAMSPKGPRAALSMLNAKRKPSRSSSADFVRYSLGAVVVEIVGKGSAGG